MASLLSRWPVGVALGGRQRQSHREHASPFTPTWCAPSPAGSISSSSSSAQQQAPRVSSSAHTSTSGRTPLYQCRAAAVAPSPSPEVVRGLTTDAPTDVEYDAVIIGSGMGGLSTAAQLAAKGARTVVLEKYLIPGGSAGHFKREGYTFDVGSSMMFGFGDKGTTNLLTRCLAEIGKKIETVPDPTQVHYHLPKSEAHPQGLGVQVWRDYDAFVEELTARFPAERAGIKAFYDECWTIFNALNTLELKSLEEPRYLLREFVKHPLACLTLAFYTAVNVGDVSRKHIKNPVLLRFIDLECFIWSTVSGELTPMMNAGMVLSDRHYGGINYPVGGVGRIPELLVEGLEERGSHVVYKANVKRIVTEKQGDQVRAVGVELADGRVYRGKSIISNATRWDTFGTMIGESNLPPSEQMFRDRYKKAPSFFSMHIGVEASVFEREGESVDCHHVLLEDWEKMEDMHGTIFMSLPSLLDPSLAPEGKHILHAFTPDWIDAWQGLSVQDYDAKKELMAEQLIDRMEAIFPGLKAGIVYKEVGTPRTHRRFLNRTGGTYGPIPSRRPLGMLSMPLNRTDVEGLYCVGDSTFPGQGVNAVVFSGFGCAHRVACDLGLEPMWPVVDTAFNKFLSALRASG